MTFDLSVITHRVNKMKERSRFAFENVGECEI